MRKNCVISLVIMSYLFVGCAAETSETVTSSNEIIQKVEETDKRESSNSSTINENKSENTKKQQEVNKTDNNSKAEKSSNTEKKPTVTSQPGPRPVKGEKISFEKLDKLSNTKYAWWFIQNNEHKPSGFRPEIKKLVDKYEGIYIGDTSKKVVYLTFDEGYENGYTPKILDTLKENDVKSLFFVTGPYIKEHPELVKRMLDEGHQVGNHTVNHPSLPTLSNSSLENELLGLEKQFSEKFNKGFKYMRPPMGEYSERVLSAAQQLGYKTVFWSYAYKDFDTKNQKGKDYAYKMVMDHLHNGAIILLHAVSKDNTEALDSIIKGIKEQGYEIRPFDL